MREFIVIALLLLIVSILLIVYLCKNKSNFVDPNMGGMGFNTPTTRYPLFLNLYPFTMSRDYALFDIQQRLRYQTLKNPNRFVGTNINGQMLPPPTTPVIIIPDLGIAHLSAIWDKNASPNLRTLDHSEVFETDTPWMCTEKMNQWKTIWYHPNLLQNENAKYCWLDNIKPSTKQVNISVDNFGSVEGLLGLYMNDLVQSLTAAGYVDKLSMFAAPYDFRKITEDSILTNYINQLSALIMNAKSLNNNKKVVILGHGLGAVIANLFFQSRSQQWKNDNIKSFISVSGSFGGCPKALRVFLSGEDVPLEEENIPIFREAVREFSGLHLLMPNPKVFNNVLSFNEEKYSASRIPELFSLAGAPEFTKLYQTAKQYQENAFKDPGVPVHLMYGTNVPTEDGYIYWDSLLKFPSTKAPCNFTQSCNNQNYDYASDALGDGTVPNVSLRVPISNGWARVTPIPYKGTEHYAILKSHDCVTDILELLSN